MFVLLFKGHKSLVFHCKTLLGKAIALNLSHEQAGIRAMSIAYHFLVWHYLKASHKRTNSGEATFLACHLCTPVFIRGVYSFSPARILRFRSIPHR